MKRIRIMGLCLVAAFAMSVAAASSASAAAPEFVTKASVGGTVPSEIATTGTMKAGYLEGASKSKVSCTGGSSTGVINGPKSTIKNVTTFTGCNTLGGLLKCNNFPVYVEEVPTGWPEGVIQTPDLAGTLAAVTTKIPGIRYYNEEKPISGPTAEFVCGEGAVQIKTIGSLIGTLKGSKTTVAESVLGKTAALAFAQSKGLQKYIAFEGEGPFEKGAPPFYSGNVLTTLAKQVASEIEPKKGEKIKCSLEKPCEWAETSGESVAITLTSVPGGDLGVTE